MFYEEFNWGETLDDNLIIYVFFMTSQWKNGTWSTIKNISWIFFIDIFSNNLLKIVLFVNNYTLLKVVKVYYFRISLTNNL